jgi:hypothetical protein
VSAIQSHKGAGEWEFYLPHFQDLNNSEQVGSLSCVLRVGHPRIRTASGLQQWRLRNLDKFWLAQCRIWSKGANFMLMVILSSTAA